MTEGSAVRRMWKFVDHLDYHEIRKTPVRITFGGRSETATFVDERTLRGREWLVFALDDAPPYETDAPPYDHILVKVDEEDDVAALTDFADSEVCYTQLKPDADASPLSPPSSLTDFEVTYDD